MSAGLDRRRALTGAAAATVGTPLLAACGGDDGGGAGGAATGTGEPGQVLAATGDVPEGSGVILSEAKLVVTQPSPGDYRAFSAVCTHQGCLVSQVSETIDCACHGSEFSLADGSPVAGPATAPLEQQPVTVRDGSVVRG